MIGKIPRSPYEILNLFVFSWSLSGRLSCVVLNIPRVRDAMYLLEPVWDLACLQCHLVVVRTLCGGELCILLGGSSIYLRFWFQNNGSAESAIWVCETLA